MSKLKELQNQLSKLQAKIAEALEEEQKQQSEGPGYWVPEKDAEYYMVGGTGEVFEEENIELYNEKYIARANCFPTRELAKAESAYLAAYQRLRAIAQQLNKGWVPDWSETQETKYIISLGYKTDFGISMRQTPYPAEVYFISSKAAKRAIKLLGEDDLKLLCTGS